MVTSEPLLNTGEDTSNRMRSTWCIIVGFIVSLVCVSGVVLRNNATSHGTPDWDYNGFHLGDWPNKYPLCAGKENSEAKNNQWQSPIDIPMKDNYAKINSPLEVLVDGGGCAKVEMEHNGHTYEASFEGCRNLTVQWKGRKYVMQQFHFHAESEVKVDGEHYPGEMHMVHGADDGSALVIGLFLIRTKPGQISNAFLHQMFQEGFEQTHLFTGKPVNPYAGLLPEGAEFFSYLGSLTTPPCTPNVEWISLIEPVQMNTADLNNFKQFLSNPRRSGQQDSYGHDNRPVQPLNNRIISIGMVAR